MLSQSKAGTIAESCIWIYFEFILFLHSVNPRGYKNTGYRTCQQKILFQNIKRNINNISTKYKYTETIKNISTKCKYARSSRLQMSINDEDSYEERQMNISSCQIDTHYNMARIYV